MAALKHTPAPWWTASNYGIYAGQAGSGEKIGTAYGHIHSGERAANARLMALAPQILEALIALLADTPYAEPGAGDCECGDYEEQGTCCHSIARHIIRQIAGESPCP